MRVFFNCNCNPNTMLSVCPTHSTPFVHFISLLFLRFHYFTSLLGGSSFFDRLACPPCFEFKPVGETFKNRKKIGNNAFNTTIRQEYSPIQYELYYKCAMNKNEEEERNKIIAPREDDDCKDPPPPPRRHSLVSRNPERIAPKHICIYNIIFFFIKNSLVASCWFTFAVGGTIVESGTVLGGYFANGFEPLDHEPNPSPTNPP